MPADYEYYYSAYQPILDYIKSSSDNSVFGWVMTLDDQIHGLMVFGRVSENSCSQYVGICNTWDRQLKNLPTTMLLTCMVRLHNKGIRFINRGGTEYEGLFKFNQKFYPDYKTVNYLEFE